MRIAESKIVSEAEARERLLKLVQEGKRVVFANGCFDTLHVGHVRYLEGAKKEGDVLMVAVNSDESVRRLKGPGRPILDEKARSQLVGALRDVDLVVIFSDPNVERLLELFRPDVHVKGTDYTAESVPERAVADRLGIRVAIVGAAKEHSTRQLIQGIRKDAHG